MRLRQRPAPAGHTGMAGSGRPDVLGIPTLEPRAASERRDPPRFCYSDVKKSVFVLMTDRSQSAGTHAVSDTVMNEPETNALEGGKSEGKPGSQEAVDIARERPP